MGIDIELLGTDKKVWYNIWTIELFCLIHAYALRKVTRKQFNTMLIILGQEYHKSRGKETEFDEGALTEGLDKTPHKDGVNTDDHVKPLVNRTIFVEKFPEDLLAILPFHGDIQDGMGYGIRVEPPIETEDITEADLKLFRYFIGHFERLDRYNEMIGGGQVFDNFTHSNGEKITPSESEKLLMPTAMMVLTMTKKELKDFWDEVTEILGDDALRDHSSIMGTLLYIVQNEISIRVT